MFWWHGGIYMSCQNILPCWIFFVKKYYHDMSEYIVKYSFLLVLKCSWNNKPPFFALPPLSSLSYGLFPFFSSCCFPPSFCGVEQNLEHMSFLGAKINECSITIIEITKWEITKIKRILNWFKPIWYLSKGISNSGNI